MEDRILGEKLHYYCSSSEGEEEEDKDDVQVAEDGFDVDKSRNTQADKIAERAYMEGPRAHNTGIKGVKEDARAYRRYILEKEQEKFDELAKAAGRFVLNDPAKSDEFDLDEDEEFMAAYRDKRMMEMKEKATPRFGRIIELTERDYCDTIDNAHSSTDVVVFIYEDHIAACRAYMEYLPRIAQEFPKCMICHIRASRAKMSANFIKRGLPCFIAYKGGDVKKAWVNIRDTIGDDAEYDVLVDGMQDNSVLPYN